MASLTWLIHFIIRILPLRFRPQFLLRRVLPPVRRIQDLSDDVLLEIFSLVPFDMQRELSLVSQRFRRLLIPFIFRQHVWKPWFAGESRPLPPAFLWPHIRVFRVKGDGGRQDGLISPEKREEILALVLTALPHMVSTRAFVLSNISGGLWPQLLDAICAAPWICQLVLESSWQSEGRGTFDIPFTAATSHLRSFTYDVWWVRDQSPRVRAIIGVERPGSMIEVETQNLRSILGPCQSTLETLKLPGEIFPRAVDTSVTWRALQELHVEGFWPETGATSLLTVLRVMPNLRIARLKLGRFESHTGPDHLLSPDTCSSFHSDTFLPHLVQFEAASLLPRERILLALPLGLESLSIMKYPAAPQHGFSRMVHKCSTVLDMLAEVRFPNMKSLELWYQIDTIEELVSDELLLACLPQRFPLLRHLRIHRWVLPSDSNSDPSPIFRKLLPQFKHLQTFCLDFNVEERSEMAPIAWMEEEYAYIIKLLRRIAEDIVPAVPWLRQISMFRPLDLPPQLKWESMWETWDVIAVPGEKIRLRAQLEDEYPGIVKEILKAPWPEDPDFSIPRSLY